MPIPVFVAFAACREACGITVAAAARELGVSQSYLWDLEQFAKTYSPYDPSSPALPFCSKLGAFFARCTGLPQPLSTIASHLSDERRCFSALDVDAAFHKIFLPRLRETFMSADGYGRSFIEWSSWITKPLSNRLYGILRPRDPSVAYFSQYVWKRALGAGERRRRRLGPWLRDVLFEPADNPEVIATINVPPREILGALSRHTRGEGWEAVFPYLLLYVSTIAFEMRVAPGVQEMALMVVSHESDGPVGRGCNKLMILPGLSCSWG